jgi:integrase
MEQLAEFAAHLRREEKAEGTVEKYERYARAFAGFVGDSPLTKELAVEWKQSVAEHYTAVGANGILAAANSLLTYLERTDLKLTRLKVQRKLFVEPERELKRPDFEHLAATAENIGKTRLALVMRTMFATGIRVGELRYITVEAAQTGQAEISLKGKTRTIFLPTKLCELLFDYAKKRKISSGTIFVTKRGNPLDRHAIWSGMKKLAKAAGVLAKKVFPHNLRRLFARTYYENIPNLTELADIMGHSDVNTTRIYTATTGAEFRKRLDSLNLVD